MTTDHDLIREAREWYGHGDLPSLTGNLLTRLADALEAAAARANQLEKAAREFADAVDAAYGFAGARTNHRPLVENVVAVARLVAKDAFPHDINRLRAALAALDAQEPKP